MSPFPRLSAVLATTTLAMAQCAFGTVTVTTAAPGCNPVIGSANPPITVSFEAPACQLGIGVGIVLGTPAQQPLGRVLVLGVGIAAQPMPALGPGCVLMPTSDVVLLQDVFASPYRIALPAAPLPPTTLHAQGAVLYSVPGLSGLLVSISEALHITLR